MAKTPFERQRKEGYKSSQLKIDVFQGWREKQQSEVIASERKFEGVRGPEREASAASGLHQFVIMVRS